MRIAFITPHLSTGGMPEYVRRSIELIDREDHEILLIEMRTEKILDAIRKRVLDLEGIRLFSAEKSTIRAIEEIELFNPDVIHFTEPSEQTVDPTHLDRIYHPGRKWKIFETCHDSSYPLPSKKYMPDKFLLVSPFQVKMMQSLGIPAELVQYDVPAFERRDRSETLQSLGLDPQKKHIFQFGIFSPRKNQSETVDIASLMLEEPVQFHFVGNTADSYSFYWKPILDNLPKNCKFWGEHKDVQQFYSVADLVVFPSIELIDDKETNPLVIKEAIAYEIPLLVKDTPVYLGMYPESDLVRHMKSSNIENAKLISEILNFEQKPNMITLSFNGKDNTLEITSKKPIGKAVVAVKDIDSEMPIYSFDVNFEVPGSAWWCKPIPINHYDFQNNPNFAGFLVQVYSEDKKELLGEATHIIKEHRVKKRIPGIDNFEPLFINYEQFFVDRIYDGFFDGERMKRIIDVGANVGLFTQWALDRFGRDSSILAFEPHPGAIEAFKKIHGDKENVDLIEGAAVHFEGSLELGIDPGNSTVSSINKKGNVITVPALKILNEMKKRGWQSADLLKIDIEGGEYDLIDEMEEFPFENLLIEFHEANADCGICTANKLKEKLETFGYEVDMRKEDTRFKASSADVKGVIIAKHTAY
jgi:FkbM family methyltransferase